MADIGEIKNQQDKEPIDGADKKTFWQWFWGKKISFIAVNIFILAFYLFSQILVTVHICAGKLNLTGFCFISATLNVMLTALIYKTYQNYNDDKTGTSR